MKKKKNKRRTKKMSEMILDIASGYIALGQTLEEKQSYLNGACTAWNIAVLPVEMRPLALSQHLNQCQIISNGKGNIEDLRHDMLILIENKLRLYPTINKKILNASISLENGQEKITIISTGN
ncbi:MAG: hypothetical protein JSV88_14215 [Candidatus Aminicenantes bacterium]|nr:MAG: hypothetical protein JSV88_14215 [Candidatus Aminicenantes bacterium]